MPTYLFDNDQPVRDIMEADGKFGPDQKHQAGAIFEVLNVFGGVEWALFMSSDAHKCAKSMNNNPFVAEWDVVWCLDAAMPLGPAIKIGSMGIVSLSRRMAHSILMAKYGDNDHTRSYIGESEHADGFPCWNNHFGLVDGFDREALLDDYEAWMSAQEVV